MKIKDILTLACQFVDVNIDFSSANDAKKALFEDYFNRILEEIATEYHPFICKEEISGRKVYFSSLSKIAIDVIDVKNDHGRKLRYRNYVDHIEIDGEGKYITYSYLPESLKSEDELKFFKIPARVYAYGIAREYLLEEGLKSDAVLFENRFKDSLCNVLKTRTNAVLPSRSWLI